MYTIILYYKEVRIPQNFTFVETHAHCLCHTRPNEHTWYLYAINPWRWAFIPTANYFAICMRALPWYCTVPMRESKPGAMRKVPYPRR